MLGLSGESLNLTEYNLDKIKEIFPEVFCEGKIDFDKLRLILGDSIENKEERYEFTWNGKSDAIRIAQTPSTGTLRPDKESSKNWDDTENLYIEGDNLEVLKLLQKSYFGKVKMIYIDPPYNTGKDFVYKDNFRDNIANYKEITSQTTRANTETNGRYHTDWLNMMYPRLKLAKNLLREDGAIFISIDDNEAMNLKKVCDEVFGEENCIDCFYIQVRYANKSLNEKDDFQKLIEQVFIYSKNKKNFKPKKPYDEYDLSKFNNEIIELTQGKEVILGNRKVKIFKPGEYQIIKHNVGSIKLLKDTWASGSVLIGNASGKYFDRYISNRKEIDGVGCLYKVEGIGEDGLGYRYFTGPKKESATKGQFYSGVPLTRLGELKNGESKKYKPILNFYDYSADFGNIRHEGDIDFRSGKKPVKMLKSFIDIIGDKNSIYLDFFSGSSSTAHAIMKLNSEDQGKRKFIMVQLPELTDEKSEHYKEGFLNICEIGKERIRRAGQKIILENKDKEGIEKLDIGFKVFKLDSSNLKSWDSSMENLEENIIEMDTNLKKDRSKEDLLYEILLKSGVELTAKIEEIKVGYNTLYNIGEGALLACLDDKITQDVIDEIPKHKSKYMDTKVIFKEAGFMSDAAKINAIQNLKQFKIEDVRSV